jgi:hypothetical protein
MKAASRASTPGRAQGFYSVPLTPQDFSRRNSTLLSGSISASTTADMTPTVHNLRFGSRVRHHIWQSQPLTSNMRRIRRLCKLDISRVVAEIEEFVWPEPPDC